MSIDSILENMVRKLKTRVDLGPADCAAIMALPVVLHSYEASKYLIREGEPQPQICNFLVSGLAIRQKLTATGGRQIISVNMAGDFLGLQHLFLDRTDHSIRALTRLQVAAIDREALQTLTLERPSIGRAMWVDALVEASIFREWIANVGRRDARSKIAHLICEISTRMKRAGITREDSDELPMTQEQIGDAVGLTAVHVSRTLKALTEEGLIERNRRHIRFTDWDGIRLAGEFNPVYLHFDQSDPPSE